MAQKEQDDGTSNADIAEVLGGGFLAYYGQQKASNAAEAAGLAQAQAAQDSVAFQKKVYKENRAQMKKFMSEAAKYSKPTPNDIKSLQRLSKISKEETQFAMDNFIQTKMVLDSVNPALKAAGDQTLKLINGQSAEILKPVQDSRDRQKSKLENQLAERFGASFRFSAAGIKALNDFDNQTSETLYNAHMGALNSVVNAASGLSNIAAQTNATQQNQVQTAIGANNALAGAYDNLAKRKLQPYYIGAQFQPNINGVLNAQGQLIGSVGNKYAGEIGSGNSLISAGANVAKSGLTNIFAGGGGGGGPTNGSPGRSVNSPGSLNIPGEDSQYFIPNLGAETLPSQSGNKDTYTIADMSSNYKTYT